MHKEKLDRRKFIQLSSIAGGGFVLGFLLPGLPATGQNLPGCEFFQPNVYLRIDKKGLVTIFVARQEMGQGVNTSLPMIVAEELDADWKDVKVEIAEHGTFPLATAIFGESPHDTGGSQSIPGSWNELRKAGAAAKAMLIEAAANQWGIKPSQCAADKGAVVNTVNMAVLTYGELVCRAAELPVPKEVTLKSVKDFKIIGKEPKKSNQKDIITGKTKFGIDIKIPGMVYASVERCPVMGGTLISFDDSESKKIPGFIKTVKYEGTGSPMNVYPGVAVIATSTWAAMQARKLLKIKWNEGAKNKESTVALFKSFAEKSKAKPAVSVFKKETKPGFKLTPSNSYTATYSGPLLAHAAIEPVNCIAEVNGDKCEIWGGFQLPDWALNTISQDCGFKKENIKINLSLIGGGFGRRLRCDFAIEAVKIARQIDKPVQLVWSRPDDMKFEAYRPANYHRLKAGWDTKGNIIEWHHHVLSTPIATVTWPGSKNVNENGGGADSEFWYDIPNVYTGYTAAEININRSWVRGVENAQNVFAMESFIDEVAGKLKKDPLQFRLQLLEGKQPVTINGMYKEPQRVADVLKLAAEKIGWNQSRKKNHFMGVATHSYLGTKAYAAHAVEIELLGAKKFRIKKIVAAIDCGLIINPDGMRNQMEGGIAFGLGQVLKNEITVINSRVQENQLDDYELLTYAEMPDVEIHHIKSEADPGGVGEVGVATVGPALCNALAAAGYRPRTQPIKKEGYKWVV